MKETEKMITVQDVEGNMRPAGIDRRAFIGIAATASMTLLLGGTLAGCSSRQEEAASTSSEQQTSQKANEQTQDAAQDPAQAQPTGGKALVAVFSWSGNTLQMAEHIRDLTGGDLFRIEPATPYTRDYNEVLDVAQAEQREDARPAIASTVDNWDEYDTIFMGYPVWWYEAPQIIKTFAEAYDFSGKTVIPFATSGGSSITGTVPAIRGLCAGAEFREGLTLDGDRVSSQLDRIEPWLDEQGVR